MENEVKSDSISPKEGVGHIIEGGNLWLFVTVGITHSSVLGKINSSGKVILGKSYTSPYDWGEVTNFHITAQRSCTHAGTVCFSCRP